MTLKQLVQNTGISDSQYGIFISTDSESQTIIVQALNILQPIICLCNLGGNGYICSRHKQLFLKIYNDTSTVS